MIDVIRKSWCPIPALLVIAEAQSPAQHTTKAAYSLETPTQAELMIPNAFSPNADGVNDYFKLKGPNEPQFFEMPIYNRSGQPIFHSRNIFKSWDGKFKSKNCPAEAYVYIIKYQFDGLPARVRSGSIILVR